MSAMTRFLRIFGVVLLPLMIAGCMQVANLAIESEKATQWTAGDPEQAKNAGPLSHSQLQKNMATLRPFATKGDAEAQFRLGRVLRMYEINEGIQFLTAAANQNYLHAQYELGRYYAAKGSIMAARDKVKAFMWYSVAASRGHRCVDKFRNNYTWTWLPLPPLTVPIYEQPMHEKYKRIPCAAVERDEIAKDMTPKEIARAKDLAKKWKPSATIKN